MEFFEVFLSPAAWIALATLLFLEVVLGIDNIVFLSIISSKLPGHQQHKARTIGLSLAMICRIGLLFGISVLIGLSEPFYTFDTKYIKGGISGQSIIILIGGLFLLYKSVSEIHHKLETPDKKEKQGSGQTKKYFFTVITQIVALDIVFSIDSVLTAVGLVSFNEFGHDGAMSIMVTAIVLAVLIMLFFATPVSHFVNKHPTIQMLGLSFLILIGVMLIVEAAHLSNLTVFESQVGEIPKGYIYFAIAFSLFVEFLNMKLSKKSKPLKLNNSDIIEKE